MTKGRCSSKILAILITGWWMTGVADAASLDEAGIDDIATRALKSFAIPGLAIAVVDPTGTRVKGYGVRSLERSSKVNGDTIFDIYSNSKAFTAAALAVLVDEGKIRWDDHVIDHLPHFQMYDPYVTREFRVRDLMIHASGLGYNAGGMMLGPGTTFTGPEVVANLRHLKPVSSFRTEFSYSNLMYIVAGELIASVSGEPWQSFVDNRVMKPLRLTNCAADLAKISGGRNRAAPHFLYEGKTRAVERLDQRTDVSGPAGGIQCSAKSMARWVSLWLAGGELDGGESLFSPEGFTQMTSPHTAMSVSPDAAEYGNTHFSAYGMGWNVSDYYGYKQVTHTGADAGMVSQVLFFPELETGFVILLNSGSAEALGAIRKSMLQIMFPPEEEIDWITIGAAREAGMNRMLEGAIMQFGKSGDVGDHSLPLVAYAGTYRDPWFGDVRIEVKGEGLVFISDRLSDLHGPMLPVGHNRFLIMWEPPGLDVLNAYAVFNLGFEGEITGLSMRAAVPFIPAGFEDIDLKLVK